MKNVTITLEPFVLEAARKAAAAQGKSLNSFLRDLISRNVQRNPGEAMEEFFELVDSIGPSARGIDWKREELYRG
ncbi:MAG TPA: hypothetical protein PLX06_03505 [Fimbriimonadaceae bacterium]|nr:hypothetical protein [Fimbriimonadaceae bacterium]